MSFEEIINTDTIEEKKEKITSRIYELIRIILDKQVPKLKTALYNNYKEMESDSNKLTKEVFESSSKEILDNLNENISCIINKVIILFTFRFIVSFLL